MLKAIDSQRSDNNNSNNTIEVRDTSCRRGCATELVTPEAAVELTAANELLLVKQFEVLAALREFQRAEL